jgi:hypothetical protein
MLGQAPAGIQDSNNCLKRLDSRFHGNDGKMLLRAFYEIINADNFFYS